MKITLSFKFTYRTPSNGSVAHTPEITIDGEFTSYQDAVKQLDKTANEEVIRMEDKEFEILEVIKTFKREI